ncbi:hypothetical protein NA57DRAFT_70579 [Rhizodiscina lignyota]|uniref:C2H2-type domain-containing protein n=1 Tax=Rhizodiscina lignyota TaxID=1504668 RepID=A0A9P4ITV5_9PEZI|nr:hypothetical protein NA57DRAFT_70579 [Rhizodiscina lignyota]
MDQSQGPLPVCSICNGVPPPSTTGRCKTHLRHRSILLDPQSEPGAEPIKCRFEGCQKTFKFPSRREKHEKTHTNKGDTYRCLQTHGEKRICGKEFKSIDRRREHQEQVNKRESGTVEDAKRSSTTQTEGTASQGKPKNSSTNPSGYVNSPAREHTKPPRQ